jgi:acyl carrier protein
MSTTRPNVQQTIYDQMKMVAKQNDKVLSPLTDDLLILESGLDSLCVAILVANLEDELGVDPFGSGDDVIVPVTLGDFVRVYQDAMP